MSGISISVTQLIIKGIPEGMLIVLALHFFTRTKIEWKKYFILSAVYIIATYLIRFLPIKLGINTILSLLVLILLFHAAYKAQMDKVARSVISSVAILIILVVSEALNIYLLRFIFGTVKADAFLQSDNPLIKNICITPSTTFIAIFTFAGNLLLTKLEKRKTEHGEAGEKNSK
ncbi:hypothetical protein SDC9_54650 [bioreactor metagenome]|uniref:Uncharacterized protein n=1 Tax=bioreactor metagenome TaxID=1076179 RepID=A0A644WXX4_9ZZZZ